MPSWSRSSKLLPRSDLDRQSASPHGLPSRVGPTARAIPETRTIEVMGMSTEPRVTDNPQASRYELWLGTTRAGFIQYRSEPGVVFLVHTEVDPAFAGQGLGERLVA